MKASFRVNGVPLWITYVMGLLAIFSTCLGVAGLIDPTTVMGYFKGADHLAAAWAGRNAGIGLAMAVAFYLRNPAAYAAVFMAAIFREIGDSFSIPHTNAGAVIGLCVFLLFDVTAFLFSFRAAFRTRASAGTP